MKMMVRMRTVVLAPNEVAVPWLSAWNVSKFYTSRLPHFAPNPSPFLSINSFLRFFFLTPAFFSLFAFSSFSSSSRSRAWAFGSERLGSHLFVKRLAPIISPSDLFQL